MLKREYRYPFFQGVPERAYSTPLFTLRYRVRAGGNLRLAVVVGKKVEALSSSRHQIKRGIVNHISDRLGPDFSVPYDIVIYTKKAAATSDSETLKKTLDQAFSVIFEK